MTVLVQYSCSILIFLYIVYRKIVKSMQSGTLHIASSLFYIFHKASSTREPNSINTFPHGGGFLKDEN